MPNDSSAQSALFEDTIFQSEKELNKVTRAGSSAHLRTNKQSNTFFGHPPQTLSLESFGNEGSNYGIMNVVDDQGNSYLMGDFAGTLTIQGQSITTSNYKSVFLSKFDEQGKLLWLKQLTSAEEGLDFHSYGWSMKISASNELYIAGNYSGGTMQVGNEQLDAFDHIRNFVIKTDVSGNVIWARGFKKDETNRAVRNLLEVSDSEVYLINGLHLVILDQNGNLIDEKSYDDQESFYQVEIYSVSAYDGKFYVTGNYSGFPALEEYTFPEWGSNAVFLAAYDENKDLEWVKYASHTVDNGGGDGYPLKIVAGQQGIHIAGIHSYYIQFGDSTSLTGGNPFRSVFLAHFDLNGEIQWMKGDTFTTQLRSMILEPSGAYLYSLNEVAQFDSQNGELITKRFAESGYGFLSISVEADQLFLCGRYRDSSYNTFISKAPALSAATDWETVASSTYGWVNFMGIEKDEDDNLYIYGQFGGIVNMYGYELNGSGGVLIKKDLQGNVKWLKVLENAFVFDPLGDQLKLGLNGDLIVTGAYVDELTIDEQTLPAGETQEVFTALFTDEGDIKYLVSMEEGFQPCDVALDSEGNAYLSMYSYTVAPGYMPVYKLNNVGEKVWNVLFKTPYSVLIEVDKDDQLLVSGEHRNDHVAFVSADGTEDVIQLEAVHNNIGLGKFDSEGQLLWSKIIGIDESSQNATGGWPTGLVTNDEGEIILNVWYSNGAKFGDQLAPNSSIHYEKDMSYYGKAVVKCDTEGEVLWFRALVEKGIAYNYGEIDLDSEGNIYVSGYQVSNPILFVNSIESDSVYSGFEYTPQAGNEDGYVAKVAHDGEWEWVKPFQALVYGKINGMSVIAPDELVVCGTTRGGLQMGNLNVNSSINHGFVAVLSDNPYTILDASPALEDEQAFMLFLNPAHEMTEVRMNLKGQSDVTIRLVDMSGRTVYERTKTAQSGVFRSEVNTSTLEAGMYILQVKTAEGLATKQLLKK